MATKLATISQRLEHGATFDERLVSARLAQSGPLIPALELIARFPDEGDP